MTDPEQDETFETYLKRRSVLPEALDDELEPPAALDHRVLEEARKAIRAQAAPDHGKQQIARAPRWAIPVALAATVLLCLSVVLNISLNTHRKSTLGGIPSGEVVLPEEKVAGSPAPHPPMVAEQAPEPPPPSNGPAMAAAPAPIAPPQAAAPATAASAQAMAPAPGAARESSATYGESTAPPASEVPLIASRSAAAANSAATLDRRADASTSGSTPGAPARDRQTGLEENSGYVTRQAAPANAAGPHPSDPKLWLQQIDALRAAGKIDAANAEMHRFRAAFPGYVAKPAPPASSEPPK